MKIVCFALMIAFNLFAVSPWEILTQGAAEDNSTRRAQAITALGTIRTVQAGKLVEKALLDKDSTVRLAAVTALANHKSRAAIPKLRAALDDDAAEVSFTAAKALWELGDHSAKELLMQVLAGERKESAGFVRRQVKEAKSTLRNRKALVWMGAKEGAGFLFGPLGYGLGLVEGITKDASAPARALAATLLAEDRESRTRVELEDALDDKSPLVRAAVLKGLGGFADRTLIPNLEPLLADKNDAVRYMAAAAIVRIEKSSARNKSSAKI